MLFHHQNNNYSYLPQNRELRPQQQALFPLKGGFFGVVLPVVRQKLWPAQAGPDQGWQSSGLVGKMP